MSDFFIARQPIFDRHLKLYAYELLFRSSTHNAAPRDFDDDSATAQVLSAGAEIGMERLVGDYLAFVNLPGRFLAEPDLLPLPPERLVLEVLETVDVDAVVISGMRALSQRGFTLALDDFVYEERYEAALDLIDMVKLDIRLLERDSWQREVSRLKERGLIVLAEKVETEEEFRALAALGCDYFQGYFFARPNIVPGRRMASNRLSLLQLLSRINDPATEPQTLAELVSRDVTLSVRALNYVNSAANGLRQRIDSVRDAIIYLGRDTIRRWVTLYLMFSVDDKPSELLTTGLVRARFCELFALEAGLDDPGGYFTVGLLSILDALMDQPMEAVLKGMNLSSDMHIALLRHRGNAGRTLMLARSLERGDPPPDLAHGVTSRRVARLHLDAMEWADEALRDMQVSA